jgi:hypothetical protein
MTATNCRLGWWPRCITSAWTAQNRTENTVSKNLLYCCARIHCRGYVFIELSPSSRRFFWFHYSGFRVSFHNIITYVYTIQSSLQLHRLMVQSPLSSRFHVSSRHVSSTQGHHEIYKTIFANLYTDGPV